MIMAETISTISFRVIGVPVGQGNLTRGQYGGTYETTKNHKPWRDSLIAGAKDALNGRVPHCGPVDVQATFIFPRPKYHYGTGRNVNNLKPTAPDIHTSKPDLDHLQRSLGDALTLAGVIRDDAQIARWEVTKVYGETPGVRVDIDLIDYQ